jgi:predicted RNase H-like HicB family nuclease
MKNFLEKYHLPKKVEVTLNKAKEGGFVVEFNNLPGCFTQVEDLSQLRENITDAILTYFDVPRTKANKLIYVPETKVKQDEKTANPFIHQAQTRFDLFVAA